MLKNIYELELMPENSIKNTNDPDKRISHIIGRKSYNSGQLSYNEFYWEYMKKNYPIIITDVSNDWECHINWIENKTLQEADNNRDANLCRKIRFDYLRQKIGNCCVPVANCSKEYFNSHQKCEMLFYDYLNYWQMKCHKRNDTREIIPVDCTVETECDRSTTENLYLKDWHLKAKMPDYEFYKVPKFFASDWLNEYLIDTNQDDYRFVYMGPKDSWTPFHADVFGSYSWSTNINGKKKWLLLPPGEEMKLLCSLGNLPLKIDEGLLKEKYAKYFVIEQMENESVFVPSGWYHQVNNLTDTISINHNWFNACNLSLIWKNLAFNMDQVIEQIEDCRQMDNFDDHCQTMLRASFGINFMDFLNILEHITAKRLCQFGNNNQTDPTESSISTALILFDKFTLNDFHMRHDLQTIYNVLEEMLQNFVICDSRNFLYRRCLSLQELTKNI